MQYVATLAGLQIITAQRAAIRRFAGQARGNRPLLTIAAESARIGGHEPKVAGCLFAVFRD